MQRRDEMSPSQMTTGQRVRGNYFGKPFTGHVTEARAHFHHSLTVVTIALEAPITLFEQERITVQINAMSDGFQRTKCQITGQIESL
jgi:hypothetical protein